MTWLISGQLILFQQLSGEEGVGLALWQMGARRFVGRLLVCSRFVVSRLSSVPLGARGSVRFFDNNNKVSHLMTLWNLSSSVNSFLKFFKLACAVIQWG